MHTESSSFHKIDDSEKKETDPRSRKQTSWRGKRGKRLSPGIKRKKKHVNCGMDAKAVGRKTRGNILNYGRHVLVRPWFC